MVHGSGHIGKTYETTLDGSESWYTQFTHSGFLRLSWMIKKPFHAVRGVRHG